MAGGAAIISEIDIGDAHAVRLFHPIAVGVAAQGPRWTLGFFLAAVQPIRPETCQSVCVNRQMLTLAAPRNIAMNIQTSKPVPDENAVVEIIDRNGHVRPWSEIRSEVLFKSMRGCNFNVSHTCDGLKVGRSTLYRWLSNPGR